MNIHEHQAKEILKEFGAPISNGVVILSLEEIKQKISKLKSKEFVLKAQIHAGGRGKAGGVKLVKNIEELINEAKKMFGKVLITNQTGPEGKEVKRLYIEEASNILKEFFGKRLFRHGGQVCRMRQCRCASPDGRAESIDDRRPAGGRGAIEGTRG